MINPDGLKAYYINVNAANLDDIGEDLECPTKFEGETFMIKPMALGVGQLVPAPEELAGTALLADVIAAYNALVSDLTDAGVFGSDE